MSFKQNYVSNQLGSNEAGSYYIVENGNLQKKTQPYAADKLPRFDYVSESKFGKLGPGSYNL